MLWSRLVATMKVSVEVNGLSVPFNVASRRLSSFARPMMFINNDSMAEVSSRGTCLLAKVMGRNFLLATAHQLKEGTTQRAPNEICIASPNDQQRLVTPSGSVRIRFPGGDAPYLDDLVFLEFKPSNYSVDLSAAFVALSSYKTLGDIDPASIKVAYALGYPTEYRGVELDVEDPENCRIVEYKSALVRLYLNVEGPSPDLERHWKATVDPGMQIQLVDFDGYSGSPVFFVYEGEERQHHLGFGGIVRTASNGIVQFYDGSAILSYIAQSIDEHG